jgi:Quinohemoprotein amine dehydrogenase A, alpha subunit, haem binding
MTKHSISIISFVLMVLLIGTFLSACGTSNSSGTGGTDGLSLIQSRCSVCHSTDRITSAHKSAADWKITVNRMISHGAQLNTTEEQTLINYLAANYK